MAKSFLITIGLFCVSVTSMIGQQVPFSPRNLTLPQLEYSACAWGDYDHDGDLDLALSGAYQNTPVTYILRNHQGILTSLPVTLQPLHFGSLEWGDYDVDGDLDLLATGMDALGEPFTRIFANNNGSFAESGIVLPGVSDGQATWGDFNNDGHPDILLAGNMFSRIYRNDGSGTFTNINAPLPMVGSPMCCWGDFNNDGQTDALVAGDTGGGFYTFLFENQDDVFVSVTVGPEPFTGLSGGQAKWADLDNDGDQDLAITGIDLYVDAYTLVYRNDGANQFSRIVVPNGNLLNGSLDLGDYDGDGLTDLILMGRTAGCGGLATTILFHNEGNMEFQAVSSLIPGYKQGGVTFGDYNNDGFSDLLFTGLDPFDMPRTVLYLNNLGDTLFRNNTPPSTPVGLTSRFDDNGVVFSWAPASDAETDPSSLTYNMMIGTQPGFLDVMAPLALPSNGNRLVAAPGNAATDTSWRFTPENAGTYYVSVQAIDNGFLAGTFSPPVMFVYDPVGMSELATNHARVYPNPAGDFVNIGLPQNHAEAESLPFKIFDITGRCLFTGFAPCNVDVSSWPAGSYLLSIQSAFKHAPVVFIKE